MNTCFVLPGKGGIVKGAGAGLYEDATHNFNVGAADASIKVNANDIQVKVGNTNGSTLAVTSTGLELATNITLNSDFSIDTGANNLKLRSGGTFTLSGAAANTVVLDQQPDGTVDLAVATVKYVNDALASTTKVYSELPTVTNGNANVTLANTPASGTERVYLNGIRQAPGTGNDYTISGNTITFATPLDGTDVVLVDYEY